MVGNQAQEDAETLIESRKRDEAENVNMGQVGKKGLYATSGGHGVLEDLAQLRMQIDFLLAKDAKRENKISEHQKHISSLESRVRCLVQSSEGYLQIRKRFLDVYKRDIKAIEGFKPSETILEGNMVTREGDAFGDAVLFDRDQRTDRSIYRELYGLDYQQVLDFGTYTDDRVHKLCRKLTTCTDSESEDQGLFLVLNAHATMVARGQTIPDDLEVAFKFFLDKVEECWLQVTDEDPNSPLGSAYYSFWEKYNEQAHV